MFDSQSKRKALLASGQRAGGISTIYDQLQVSAALALWGCSGF